MKEKKKFFFLLFVLGIIILIIWLYFFFQDISQIKGPMNSKEVRRLRSRYGNWVRKLEIWNKIQTKNQ